MRSVVRRSRHQVLTSVLGLALIALVLLLPDLAPDVRSEVQAVEAFRGRIETIQERPADEETGAPRVPMARVVMLEGPQTGEVLDAFLQGPGGSQSVANYRPGDEVVVTFTADPTEAGPFIAVSDRWRVPMLQALAVLFAAAVVVVGGWHGVRALVALGLTVAVILKILLPLVISGVPPVPLAVLTASGVTVATIVLTEGVRRSSIAAILGTTGSLAITGLLAAAATAAMGFTYAAGSDLAFLITVGGQGLDLRGVLLAAFILGAVGVLDDVTVTQAALVEELALNGTLRGPALFASSMRIGRSHIAATVNTLFLAYVGAGLPLLVILLVSRQPGALVFNDEVIATEIVRTVVGSLGIVAAVPLTTFIAATLVRRQGGFIPDPPSGPLGRGVRVGLVGAVIVALLAATAALPLTGGPRPALAPDAFDPGGSGSAGASLASSAEPSHQPAAEQPRIVSRGDPVPITVDGVGAGTVTVVDWTIEPREPPAAAGGISVEVRYEATEAMSLALGRWELLLADGTQVPLELEGESAVLDEVLEPGTSLQVTLGATVSAPDADAFVVYVDQTTSSYVFAVPVE